ncbi:MAG TPA: transcriptional repressor [Ignavibacteriaceae bacterium]|nr:transcriptional repressor [Ignavibacteriaceae bacterium]
MKHKEAEETLREYLKNGNHRVTPERFIVLDAALDCEKHFSADELYASMKSADIKVSRATVYNTLDLLADCSLLTIRNFGDNMKRYESSVSKQSHDHLICINCGKIVEFTSDEVGDIYKEVCNKLNFEPVNYSFNIFAKCKNKENCPHVNEK